MTGITRDLGRLLGHFGKETAVLVKVGPSSEGERGSAGHEEVGDQGLSGSRLQISPSQCYLQGQAGKERG